MFFKSDNSLGAPDVMFEAMKQANEGPVTAYGADPWTEQVTQRFSELFERDVAVYMVATGTAANALGLSLYAPPWAGVVCHRESHIMVDECGAVEFYSGGAKLLAAAGVGGKLTPETIADVLYYSKPGNPHYTQPKVLSLTQITEVGTTYSLDELRALCAEAKSRDMKVHMDGARFANALVSLGCSAADMTWKAGVDVLSFGATKNGTLAAEAIVVFDMDKAEEMMHRRMRGGHLVSKSRFLAAQLLAYLDDDLWLKHAANANDMAARLAAGLRGSNKVRHAFDVEANMQFVIMKNAVDEQLQAAGAGYYSWPGRGPEGEDAKQADEIIARLVCGFATTPDDVDAFIAAVEAVE